ncbi:TPA: hypothetical protein N0F65_004162 [Lagenidium giganteum]|uniref:MIR domain-containing protein n=1 Tax=Lagenidium giganteum TaxID=4803 RepID=A0AAV2ZCN3_9STRA|nr:TPA: hypothetical protein N0F65_004162 [Lagenidium giganteum]
MSPLAIFTSKKQPHTAHNSHPVTTFATDSRTNPQLYGTPFLEYGMVVSLACDDRNGLVAAEGFASREVRLEKLRNTAVDGQSYSCKLGLGGKGEKKAMEEGGMRLLACPFRDCLFEIVPRMTYDATIALNDLIDETSNTNANGRMRHSLADLKFKRDAEMRLNAVMYKKLRGQQVKYGQIIQLRHVKSGRFLAVDTFSIPFRGAEYIQVCLEAGSPRAHFAGLPRFKLRTKGAPVQLTDQLVLSTGNEVQPFSLYVSNRSFGDGNALAVVGSSAHSSAWRVLLYDRMEDDHMSAIDDLLEGINLEGLRGGSCVRLLHLESNSWLQYNMANSSGADPITLQFSDTNDKDLDEGAERVLSADTLWELERTSFYEGGVIKWSDTVTLRHLLSGKYLSVSSTLVSPATSARSANALRQAATSYAPVLARDDPQALRFMPTAVTDEQSQIENADVVLVYHLKSKGFLHSPETHASSMTDIRISSKPLSSDHTVSSFSVVSLPGARDEDAFKVVSVPQSEIDDTLLLLSYKRILRQFVTHFRTMPIHSHAPHDESANHFEREETLALFRNIEQAVRDLISYCAESAKLSDSMLKFRQNMFRVHLYIDLLMEMIKAPFQRYGGPFAVERVASYNPSFIQFGSHLNDSDDEHEEERSTTASSSPTRDRTTTHTERKTRNASYVSRDNSVHNTNERDRSVDARGGSGAAHTKQELHAAAMKSLNRILPAINTLLVHIFYGNRANELYMVKYAMPTLMELLGNGFQTSLPLSYLLRENRNLVESITAYTSIIRNFFELIKTQGKSIRYMQFLVALCTSRGRGVPKTQEAICELLFNPENGYRDCVIVPIQACEEGFALLLPSKGISAGSEGSSMEKLFDGSGFDQPGNWMSLAKFYENYYLHGKHRTLGQYCYGLLQLYVSLCLDRNYVSIEYVQKTFPRENLLKSVMDPCMSRSLRAVLMDLIRVAYIDCEPQKAVTCPNYTRIWTEVGEKSSEVLAAFSGRGYSQEDLHFFSMMKDFYSSYFEKLNGTIVIEETPTNELTLSILRGCKKMVEFGMYSSESELSPLVRRLVAILDERTDLVRRPNAIPQPRHYEDVGKAKHQRQSSRGKQDIPTTRDRGSSVTDGRRTLFSTFLSPIHHSSKLSELPIEPDEESLSDQAPSSTLQHRSSALLDGVRRTSCNAVDQSRVLARQYSGNSSVWRSFQRGSATTINHFRYPSMAPTRTEQEAFTSMINVQGKQQKAKEAAPYLRAVANRTNHAKHASRASITSQSAAVMPRRGEPSSPRKQQSNNDIRHREANFSPSSGLSAQNHPSVDTSRHQMNEYSRVVMEIKDKICGIFQHIDSMRLDYQISVLLASFKARQRGQRESPGRKEGDGAVVGFLESVISQNNFECGREPTPFNVTMRTSPLEWYMFERKALECKFSLNQLAQKNVNTVLMQMLMYEYPPLVSKALELLLQQYNQHDNLLKAMQSVQLLISDETITIHNKLKDDVDNLRRLSETTEVWMDLTSKSDFEKADTACALLKTLMEVVTNKDSLQRDRQRRATFAAGQQSSSDFAMILDDASESVLDGLYAPRFAIEKKPPNRKLMHLRNRYKLPCSHGRVSQFSSSHDILSMFKWRMSKPKSRRSSRASSNEQDSIAMESEARRLLRNLKAAQYVLNMMHDGAHFYEAHFPNRSALNLLMAPSSPQSPNSRMRKMLLYRQRDQIHDVFLHGMQFLCAFCGDDVENQFLLAPHGLMIAQYVGDMEVAQQLLASIYCGNLQLQKSIPTEMINTIVARLAIDGPDPRYLLSLESLVLCNEMPILENQLLVLFQLIKSLENASVLQYFDDSNTTISLFGKLLQRHAKVMAGELHVIVEPSDEAIFDDLVEGVDTHNHHFQEYDHREHQFDSDDDSSVTNDYLTSLSTEKSYVEEKEYTEDTKSLEYHCRLLHLFAACAMGKNTRVQEICQQIVPIANVLELIAHPDCTEGLRFSLLRFLHQVYLVADELETPKEDVLVQILIHIAFVCETSVGRYLREIHVEDYNRKMRLSLHKKKKHVASLGLQKAKTPLESPTLNMILYAVIPAVVAFVHQFPIVIETNDEAQQCIYRLQQCLSMLFAVSPVKNWQLEDSVMTLVEDLMYYIDKMFSTDLLELEETPVSMEKAWLVGLTRDDRVDFSSCPIERDTLDACHELLAHDLEAPIKTIRRKPTQPAIERNLAIPEPPKVVATQPPETTHTTDKKNDSLNQSTTISFTEHSSTTLEDLTDLNTAVNRTGLSDALRTIQPIVIGPRPRGDRPRDSLVKAHQLINGSPPRASHENRSPFHSLMSRFPIEYFSRLNPFGRKSPMNEQLTPLANASPSSPVLPRYANISPFFSPTEAPAIGMASAVTGGTWVVHGDPTISELDHFLTWLRTHPRVHQAVRDELNEMVQSILSVEATLQDEYEPQMHICNIRLTFDQVVAKLVAHVEAFQESNYVKMNLILLDVFIRTIYAVEDSKRMHKIQIKLNHLGVTRLVVQLISSRDDDALFARSIELGVALLDGMNAEVQESFYGYWIESENVAFFEKIQGWIERACKLIRTGHNERILGANGEHQAGVAGRRFEDRNIHHRIRAGQGNQDPGHAPAVDFVDKDSIKRLGSTVTYLFRFLQLLCEGHYLNAQRHLIHQPQAKIPVNIVECTTSFLLDTYLALTDINIGLIIQLFETITEFCQGPCVEAQETVANYKFISAVNALMMHSFDQTNTPAISLVRQLRGSIVITLLSLLEGRSDRVIHAQLVQELNFDSLKKNLVDVYGYFLTEYKGRYAGNVKCSKDSYLMMGFNIYILLQQLADRHPTSASWIPTSKHSEQSGLGTSSQVMSPSDSLMYVAFTNGLIPDYKEAYLFFQSKCARVEIVWSHQRIPTSHAAATSVGLANGGLEVGSGEGGTSAGVLLSKEDGALIPFYFPLHPICFCLTDQSKRKLVWQVSRGANKLHDFYSRSDKLVDEMVHQSRLRRHPYISKIAKQADLLKRLSFLLALAINLVVLLFYRVDGINEDPYPATQLMASVFPNAEGPYDRSQAIDVALTVAGSFQVVFCTLILVCYLINSAPLHIKKGWKRRNQSEMERRSKETASVHRRLQDIDDKESFQDTELLLRSLREREEEYNYFFFPRLSRKHLSQELDHSTDHHTARTNRRSFFERVRAAVTFGHKSESAIDSETGHLPKEHSNNHHALEKRQSTTNTFYAIKIISISTFFLVKNPRVAYYLWQIGVAIWGSYVNKLYFAFHLLDVVNRYQELHNVLRSIVRPAKVLGLTVLLYLAIVYVFAIIGFSYFRADYTPSTDLTNAQIAGEAPYQCQRLFQCFLVSLDQGFKSNGGLGGYLKQHELGESLASYGRLAFDLMYNTILIIMLLNIVFGVIIDTFASLRTADKEKLMDMQNRCFICSIDAYTFDRSTKRGFHEHIYTEHNMWHYLYMFVHIRKKPITEYNGLELYLAMRMAKKDVCFLPSHRALALEKVVEEATDRLDNAHSSLPFVKSDELKERELVASTPITGHQRPRISRMGSLKSLDETSHSKGTKVRGRCRSCSVGASVYDRDATAKLERMEATIDTLVSAQQEIRDHQRRADEKQTQLMELVSALKKVATMTSPAAPPSPPPNRCTSFFGADAPASPVHSTVPVSTTATAQHEPISTSAVTCEAESALVSTEAENISLEPPPSPQGLSRSSHGKSFDFDSVV